MSDGIVIPLDVDDTKAKSKLARIKKDANASGKAFAQAGAVAGRIGGPVGGVLGRATGGFAGGSVMGWAGLGATGGGMLLSAFLQRDGERMTMAKDREARIQARAADARSVMKSKDDLAAGGLNFLSSARRMISLGADSGLMKNRIAMGASHGLSAKETIGAWESSGDGVSSANIAVGLSTGLIGDTPQSVAGNIKKFNGIQNAIAAINNMSQEDAGAAMERSSNDPRSKNLARAGSAMSPVEQAQLDALMGGETARVLEGQAKDTLNPGAKLAAEAAQKMMDSVNQLRAAADAQSTVGALLAEMGRVVGLSDGSAARQLAVGAQAASE